MYYFDRLVFENPEGKTLVFERKRTSARGHRMQLVFTGIIEGHEFMPFVEFNNAELDALATGTDGWKLYDEYCEFFAESAQHINAACVKPALAE